jgi:drug/metabolite transporter (DMT)-like permease
MNEQSDGITASYSALANGIGRATWMGVVPMIVLLIGSVILAFRGGADQRHLLLGVGALLSAAAIFAYAVIVSTKLKGHQARGFGPMLVTLSALIPYAFGCYLFFYEGLWRLTNLRHGFSARVVIYSFLFTIGGYWLVSATHRLSETAKFARVVPIESDGV